MNMYAYESVCMRTTKNCTLKNEQFSNAEILNSTNAFKASAWFVRCGPRAHEEGGRKSLEGVIGMGVISYRRENNVRNRTREKS